ncbi:MAG: ankyrin repeat domain-containing protein [Anaerolineae bacterium]
MAIQGFCFVPVTDSEKARSIPSHLIEMGKVSQKSTEYRVYAVLKDPQEVKLLEQEDAAKVCRKIQRCLDDLPSFCQKPECWGQAGFRFSRIRIPNTFETANFLKCGGDVFKRCQELTQSSLGISFSSSVPASSKRQTPPLRTHQTIIDDLLDCLDKKPAVELEPDSATFAKVQVFAKEAGQLALEHQKATPARKEEGLNILHYLIVYGDKGLIQCAMGKGLSSHDRSFLYLICDSRFQAEILHVFKEKGFDVDSLKDRLEKNTLDIAKMLLEMSPKMIINYTEHRWETALHRACAGENLALVQLLLEKGADVNHKDLAGRTPIYYSRTPEIVQALLDKGASLSHRSTYSEETPLQYFFAQERARRYHNPSDEDKRIVKMISVLSKKESTVNSIVTRYGKMQLLPQKERKQTWRSYAMDNEWIGGNDLPFSNDIVERSVEQFIENHTQRDAARLIEISASFDKKTVVELPHEKGESFSHAFVVGLIYVFKTQPQKCNQFLSVLKELNQRPYEKGEYPYRPDSSKTAPDFSDKSDFNKKDDLAIVFEMLFRQEELSAQELLANPDFTSRFARIIRYMVASLGDYRFSFKTFSPLIGSEIDKSVILFFNRMLATTSKLIVLGSSEEKNIFNEQKALLIEKGDFKDDDFRSIIDLSTDKISQNDLKADLLLFYKEGRFFAVV